MRKPKNTEVKVLQAVGITALCEVEGCPGKLKFGGTVLCSNPPQYPHICDTCGARVVLDRSYPCIEYREVEAP